MPIKFCSEAYFFRLEVINEPKISDLGPQAWSPSWRTFTSWKNLSTSVGFEPTNLGSQGKHVTPRPPKPTETEYNNLLCLKIQENKFISYLEKMFNKEIELLQINNVIKQTEAITVSGSFYNNNW